MSSWFGGGGGKKAVDVKPLTPFALPTETGAHLLNCLKPDQLQWIQERSGATETQTFYVDVENGRGMLFVQLVYSTIGLSASVQATARYYLNPNENIMASTSFSGSAFKLSADKCSVQVQDDGKTLIQMSVHPQTGHSVYKVKQTHGNLAVEFQFEGTTAPVQIKDGKTLLGDKGANGYVLHRFIPSGKVEGTISVNSGPAQPFKGRAAFIHAVQNAKPHQVATTWDCLSMQFQAGANDEGAVVLLQFKAPAEYGSVVVTQGLVVRNGAVMGVTADALAKHVATNVDKSTKYPVPTAIEYRWAGKSVAKDAPFSVSIDAKPQTLVGKVDILGELPYLLRKVLQALIAKPFAYIWFDKLSGKLMLDGETVDITGHAYLETTFINSE